jgi:cobalt-zinc-cadmium efflux system protein
MNGRLIHTGRHNHDHARGMLSALDEAHRRGMRAIQIALIITLCFMVIQFIGGLFARSLALIADAAHMLTDAASFLLSLFAFWIAKRPPSVRMSYGYYRAEIIGALASALALWVICAFLIYEAIRRFAHPAAVRGGLIFIIALVTLVMNLVTMGVLHRSQGESLNVRAAYLHVLGDLLGNIGVIIAGAIIFFTGWVIADPILTILFTLLILYSTLHVIKEGVEILMEAAPRGIDPMAVQQTLKELDSIEDVHDLHIWTVASGRYALSAHLISTKADVALNQAHEALAQKYGIEHMTLQVEHPEQFESKYCFDCNPPT